jgi:hypothetical protein
MNETIITYSELSSMRECGRRHKFSYVDGLVRKVKSRKLAVGSIGHLAVEAFLKTSDKSYALSVYDSESSKDLAEIKSQAKREEAEIELANVRGAFRVWMEKEGAELIDKFNIIECEKAFKISVVNPETRRKVPKAYYAGRIDGIAQHKKELWTANLETKFLASFDHNINLLNADMQVSCYWYAIGRMTGEFPTATLYNVIKKPRYKKKSSESLHEFQDRVYSQVLDKYPPESDGGFFDIGRIVTRNENHFRVVERELYEGIRELRRIEKGQRYAYRNQGMHCSWKCAFKEICLVADPVIIDQLYEKKKYKHEELGNEIEGNHFSLEL